MEAAVAHVSRHLDHVGAPPFYPRTDSLLKLHFCQELRRQAGRLGRVQAIGLAAELEEIAPTSNWVEGFNAWLDIEKFRAHLSERSWITFAMRYLGHPWQEICEKLGIAISTAQNCFRQDVREARALLNGNNTDTNTNGKAGKK